MLSSHNSDKRVYFMKSVVLIIAGVIFNGGIARVGRILGNKLLGGDGVDLMGLGVDCCDGDSCGTGLDRL